jgi:hypothetical protein
VPRVRASPLLARKFTLGREAHVKVGLSAVAVSDLAGPRNSDERLHRGPLALHPAGGGVRFQRARRGWVETPSDDLSASMGMPTVL